MATKTLFRLLIALVVLGGLALIVYFTGPGGGVSEVSSTTTKAKVFPDFPINDVAKVVLKNKDASLHLVKGEKSWEVVEREGYEANTESVVTLLRKVWDLNITQSILVGRSQYGRLGLLDPAAEDSKEEEAATQMVFEDKDGKELATLWLGKVFERSEGRPDPFGGGMAKSDAGRYIKRGDGNSVFLVSDTFSEVKTDAADWIDKSFFKVEKIKSIEIASVAKADDWKLERKEENGDFVLANAGAGEVIDSNKVSSMKTAFSNPQIEDVYVGKEKGEQKLDAATFKIDTFDGFHYEVAVGEKSDLNELPMTIKVSAELPKERKVGEEEGDDEKKRLDKEFEERSKTLQTKLENEKRLEGHVFKVRSYLVDSIQKKRSELMEEKKEEKKEGTSEVAPGVSLPGLPQMPAPAPEAKPEAAKPAPAPAPEAKPEAAKPAPAPEAKPEAAKPAPAPEAKPEAAKPAPAPEAKPEAAKPAPAPEAKPEAAKPAPAPEAKPEAAKPAPAPEAKPEAAKSAPAPEAKPEAAKSAPAPEAKPEAAKPAPAPEAKPEAAKPAPAPEAKPEAAKPAPAPEAKPEAPKSN